MLMFHTKGSRKGAFQRVEKGMIQEKIAILHAGQTARNRDKFCFLASGSRTKVLPPSKKQKAQMPLKPLV